MVRVGLGAAELVVVPRGPAGAVHQVLQLPAPAAVADDGVQLAVRAEPQHPAVLVAASRLPLIALARRQRAAVALERAQLQQVLLVAQGRAVPVEAVDAVAAQRDLQDLVGVGKEHVFVEALVLVGRERVGGHLEAAAGPVEIDARVGREVRVQGDAEQPALGCVVDAEIEHGVADAARGDPPHAAGVLLEDERDVTVDEGHGDWQRQLRGPGADAQLAGQHLGPGALRAGAVQVACRYRQQADDRGDDPGSDGHMRTPAGATGSRRKTDTTRRRHATAARRAPRGEDGFPNG